MKLAQRTEKQENIFRKQCSGWTLQSKVLDKCVVHLQNFSDRVYEHYLEVMKQFHCISVQCGAGHTLVLTQSGVVWSGGYEEDGQIGHGTLLDQLKYIYGAQSNKNDAENMIEEMLLEDESGIEEGKVESKLN